MADPSASYGDFLREVIRTYWRTRRGRRVRFLALLLASRDAWGVAVEEAANVDALRKVLTGAAGATAVAVVLRLLLGGPLGMLLTGASVAGLVAVYARNHRDVLRQAERCRELVEGYRPKWKAIIADHEAGNLRNDQRDLMIDGLLRRFLDELDADLPEPPADPSPETSDPASGGRGAARGDGPPSTGGSSFADHVASSRRRRE